VPLTFDEPDFRRRGVANIVRPDYSYWRGWIRICSRFPITSHDQTA
jgi:hypothetical protein